MFKFIHAKQASDIVDPSATLGIEITDRDIAALCGLGNIDGQHGTGIDIWPVVVGAPPFPASWAGRAACAIAATIRPAGCAYCGGEHPDSRDETGCDMYSPLLPQRVTFATSRPDLDSVAAMAVLMLRSIGLANVIDYDLCATIAARDSFVAGPWEPSPLPTIDNPWPRKPSTVDGSRETAHLGMIASPRRGDPTESLGLTDRVITICIALAPGLTVDQFVAVADVCGVADLGDVDFTYANHRMGWYASILDRARDAVLSLRIALAKEAQREGALVNHGSLVEVRVAHAGAMGLGYCVAPVVVAFDQANAGKVTIAEYGDSERRVDFDRLVDRLNAAETSANGVPKWGGQAKIKGSPIGPGTRLPDNTILDIVRSCLIN